MGKFVTGDKVRCVSIANYPTTSHVKQWITVGEIYTINTDNLNNREGRDYIVTLDEVDKLDPNRPYFHEDDFERVEHLPTSAELEKAWDRAMGLL